MSAESILRSEIPFVTFLQIQAIIIGFLFVVCKLYTEKWEKINNKHLLYLQLNDLESPETAGNISTNKLREILELINFRYFSISKEQYFNIIATLYQRSEIKIDELHLKLISGRYGWWNDMYINDCIISKLREITDKDLFEEEGIPRELEFLYKLSIITKDGHDFIKKQFDNGTLTETLDYFLKIRVLTPETYKHLIDTHNLFLQKSE